MVHVVYVVHLVYVVGEGGNLSASADLTAFYV